MLVGGQGGQLDLLSVDGYGRLGIPPAMTPITNPLMADPELGLVFHADSAFLRGIRLRTLRDDARAGERHRLLRALGQRHGQQPAQSDVRHQQGGRRRRSSSR